MFSVVNVVAKIYLSFSFLYQIPRNFQFFVVQAIVFDFGAIWDFPIIYDKACIFNNLYSQDQQDFLS